MLILNLAIVFFHIFQLLLFTPVASTSIVYSPEEDSTLALVISSTQEVSRLELHVSTRLILQSTLATSVPYTDSADVDSEQTCEGHGKKRKKEDQSQENATGENASNGNNNPDDGDGKIRKKKPRVKAPTSDGPALACPFYIFDCYEHKDCAKYEFYRYHDIKQHLDRRHVKNDKLNYCSLCFRCHFTTKAAWEDHSNSCTNKYPFPSELLDKDEYDSLKNWPRLPLREQWMSMWRALFKGHPEPESPYLGTSVDEQLRSHLIAILERQMHVQRGDDMSHEPCHVPHGLSILEIKGRIDWEALSHGPDQYRRFRRLRRVPDWCFIDSNMWGGSSQDLRLPNSQGFPSQMYWNDFTNTQAPDFVLEGINTSTSNLGLIANNDLSATADGLELSFQNTYVSPEDTVNATNPTFPPPAPFQGDDDEWKLEDEDLYTDA